MISYDLIEQILAEEGGITSPTSVIDKPEVLETFKHDVPSDYSEPPMATASVPHNVGYGMRPYSRVSDDEIDLILNALKLNYGNKTRAAISLGLTPRQLRYRLKKLEIEVSL